MQKMLIGEDIGVARRGRRQANRAGWVLEYACVAACAGVLLAGEGAGARGEAVMVEPPIIPTVHPVLTPTSAISLPLMLRGDEASVWRKGADQRMYLRGRFVAQIGYRTLRSDEAAVFLTPTKEAGETTFDVAIYLAGNVRVEEGASLASTVTSARELLVTTRVSGAVQLSGTTPRAQGMEDNAVVKRGDKLRTELLTMPAPAVFVPEMVMTEAEEALGLGWIARGPGNRIIAGPGEAIAAGVTTTAPATGVAAAKTVRPSLFATGDRVEQKTMGDEQVGIVRGNVYVVMSEPGGAAGQGRMELRAERAVLFSPLEKGAATEPAGEPKKAFQVTGAYLEGDVTLDYGAYSMRASKLYFDFLSRRVVVLDGIVSTEDETRKVPLYMRAEEIRGFNLREKAAMEFAAKSATFSTSEFYLPHYHIGASDVYLRDITPRDDEGNPVGPNTAAFKARNATLDVRGVPIFWWPYLGGDTSKNDIPLRTIRMGNSTTYGMTLQTSWDIFGLAGQPQPPGVKAGLNLDYWGKRGPAAGVDASYKVADMNGEFRSYVLEDHGTDNLGVDRNGLEVPDAARGRVELKHRQELDDHWTLQLEASYISDPNFLEQYFQQEFDSEKEHETSIYVKRAEDTEALTFLGKWSLYDFTANADVVDDQYVTNKEPEIKYWRIGDSLLDMFTYYSESGAANVQMMATNRMPSISGLQANFPAIPPGMTFRQYYQSQGWTTDSVLRGDTRHEVDMPLQIGDLKLTPYAVGRVTAWDESFPDTTQGGSTTRLWGQGGVRGAMEFWRVYDDAESNFWDIHRMRHVIEPEVNLFQTASSQNREDLQPFDRDVEGISDASGGALTLHQKWQTKRGGPGHWRNVDWLVVDTSYVDYWNKDPAGKFLAGDPLRGVWFLSRPELGLVKDSINLDATWRVGERVRYTLEGNYNTDDARLEQLANGIAIDHSPDLTYFIGNRYIRALGSDQWTVGVDYQLTRKYEVMASESYDIALGQNILSSLTLLRKLPRFNAGFTVTYDANTGDTSVLVTLWPQGFPGVGFGNGSLMRAHD